MAEEQAQEPTKAPDGAEAKEPSIKDLMSQLEAIKQAQSGSDKKVRELSGALTQAQKEKDELLKQSMSEKQRYDFELQQREKAAAAKEAELHAKDVALTRADVVSSLDVPRTLAGRIAGDTREEMEADAKRFMESFNAAVAVEVNKRLVSGAPKPKAGDVPETKPGDEVEPFDWTAANALPRAERDKAWLAYLERVTKATKGK